MPTKPTKFKLPTGALSPTFWNTQPEELAAFYTFQSQRYFQEYTRMYTPEVKQYFDDIVYIMEAEAECDTQFHGWKALANQWCHFLNSLIFHDDSRFPYHLEANEYIASVYTENFGIYHRTVNISAAQMDHMSFSEALGTWRGLRKAQPEDFRHFELDDDRWEWVTTTKLVDCSTRETICEVDDSYWINLKPNPSRDTVTIISIPMIQGSTAEN